MIATWSPRAARWRSTQLWQTLSSPSSYHLMPTSPSNDTFLIRVGGFDQSSRSAISPQNASGSSVERRYISRYLAASQLAPRDHSSRTGIVSAITPSLNPRGEALRLRAVVGSWE